MRQKKYIFNHIDFPILITYLLLVTFGLLSIYAAVYDANHSDIFDLSQRYGKQFMWIGSSALLIIAILVVDLRFFENFAYIIYGLTMLLLIAVLGIGDVVAGSKSWIQIGSFAIQPSEFAKFATNLALAKYLSSSKHIDLKKSKDLIKALVIIGVPSILIFLQNDTGSALVYSALVLVLYRQGFSGNILVIGVLMTIIFVLTLLIGKWYMLSIIASILLLLYLLVANKKMLKPLMIILLLSSTYIFSIDYVFENILQPHQKTRIEVLLGMKEDFRGAGYNVHQSLIAIGSGGASGKGFLEGTQTKFNFVPEQSTDFIFCTVGEEWGFLGSAVIISLFVFLFIRIIIVAERQRSDFARIYGYGVASILFFHFAINIAMTLGLAPVIGIPLPFFSYGGSSLWSFTILLFIFVKLDSHRKEIL